MFSLPDITLLLTVTAVATIIAYLRQPRLKALVYTLPVPFLSARYASGQKIDATHVLGMFATLVFLSLAYWLHRKQKWPIVLAEAVGIAAFCGLGLLIGRCVPKDDLAFWIALAAVLPLLVILRVALKPIYEPGHRTRLAWYVKMPIVFAVVLAVIAAKEPLRGFMPTFPFVGMFAVYESRHSLRTLIRQFVRFCIGFMGLLATMRLLQPVISESRLWLRLVCGLIVGAGVYLIATGGRPILPEVSLPPSLEDGPSPGDDRSGG